MAVYGGAVYGGFTYTGLPTLAAFDYELGTFEGRIRPDNAAAIGGDYVYCLGSDKLPAQMHDLAYNDVINLTQSIDLTGVNFLRATWRVRQPAEMPTATLIPGAGILHGNQDTGAPGTWHGVLNYSDPVAYPIDQAGPQGRTLVSAGPPPTYIGGADRLVAIVSTTDIFVPTDAHRIIRIANAGNPGNNGDRRITGILSPRIAIMDVHTVVQENPLVGAGTATLLGARWRAR